MDCHAITSLAMTEGVVWRVLLMRLLSLARNDEKGEFAIINVVE
jgi:hypothetical protein